MNKDALTNEKLSYEIAKQMARDGDAEVRRVLAARDDLKPEILYFLAEDTDTAVRQAVANNLSAPRKADVLLAKDDDADVRGDLAGKIAQLAPGLSPDEQDKAKNATYETLEMLAHDQITKVRGILSEALKDFADAPPDVIKTLAMDTEIEVSGPVLEFSPALSDDDLLQIIEYGPASGGLNAISKRAGVSEAVSDGIIGTDDVSAIAHLLSNDSAQIREAALDDLIDRAPDVELWHAPLVGRPKLPSGAEIRLAGFLADNLLGVLQERADLDPDNLEAVKAAVHQRIGVDGADGTTNADGAGQDFLNMNIPIEMLNRLYQARKLGGNVIGKALKAGDYSFVLASLIVRAELDEAVVKRMFVEKSARGITAAAWKAGLSTKMAAQIQQRMGRIAPADVVMAEVDEYSMSEDDLQFQIDFFIDLSAKGAG